MSPSWYWHTSCSLGIMVAYARREILLNNKLIHKVWRGHNREWIFAGNVEKDNYLEALNKTIGKDACKLHSICLMSNHTHEIYQIHDLDLFCGFVRKHHSIYGRFYNKIRSRTGSVSESRPKTIPIRTDIQEIVTTFYNHTNPLRGKLVKSVDELKDYSWSTHLFFGYGIFKPWMRSVILPEWYFELGTTPNEQRRYYLYLLNEYLHIPEEQFIQLLSK